MLVSEYCRGVADTDVLDSKDLRAVLQGLFGEVGGIMSTVKKLAREGSAYPEFRSAAEEEFGDALWYLNALCRRLDYPLEVLLGEASNSREISKVIAASREAAGEVATIDSPAKPIQLDDKLFELGHSAADLLESPPSVDALKDFTRNYLDAMHAAGLSFASIVKSNLAKARGAFVMPEFKDLPDFDINFNREEQLPRKFRIRINERPSGKSYIQWNGVFIGDPLTDNIKDPDGYRFHDVFHFAYAAVLHWSPVFRALIKQKRKSDPHYDDEQDGGRAIVVEEGVSAWVFARAKELNFFEGQDHVSLNILKNIAGFVKGFEVEECPLKLWERAILQGYAVFRKVRSEQGGWVVGDRGSRTLAYEPLQED